MGCAAVGVTQVKCQDHIKSKSMAEVAIGLPEVAWVVLWLEQPRSSAETLKSQKLWLESSKSSYYVLIFSKYAI